MITGFTTNCSIVASSHNPCYTDLYTRIRDSIGSKSVSFQIWKNDPEEAIAQVNAIHSIDPRIFVKIPIVNTDGNINENVIRYCVERKIPINLTAIHTMSQIEMSRSLITPETTAIVSVFAGPISDTGLDPEPFIRYAKEVFSDCPSVRILWAGCRELYTIVRARQSGADIITIPDTVIERMQPNPPSLEELTLKRVRTFFTDAESRVRI